MYFTLGKVIGILFFIFSIGILFTKEGRSNLADIVDDTIFSDMLRGNFEEYEDAGHLELLGVGAIMVVILLIYVLIILLASLCIIVLYPLVLCFALAGFILKKKANKSNNN
jgi:hypothetical protein